MKDIFTDIHEKEHAGTVPRGKLRPEVFEKLKALASTTMPPEYANILSSTPNPFVSKVYDVLSPRAVFFDGKLFLVGDARITIRPNAGMSTTNAAHDCNKLEEVIQGKITPKHWEKAVLRYGAAQQGFAMVIAAFGLESKIVAVWRAIQWLLLLLRQKLRIA
jgi:2-polyprenyl-6-methoxyphenol hydroxylase-like FAD-dependent oxidoreductase